MKKHINGYSLALFSIAKEEKKLKKYKENSILIINSLEENKDYINLMSSNSIDKKDKQKLLNEAFSKRIDNYIMNLLFILSDRKFFQITIDVFKTLIKYINNSLNIKEGIVYTTKKLTLDQIKKFETKAKEIFNLEVSLKNKIDTELISGFKLQVGDEIIEDSIVSRISDIKNILLRKDK